MPKVRISVRTTLLIMLVVAFLAVFWSVVAAIAILLFNERDDREDYPSSGDLEEQENISSDFIAITIGGIAALLLICVAPFTSYVHLAPYATGLHVLLGALLALLLIAEHRSPVVRPAQ